MPSAPPQASLFSHQSLDLWHFERRARRRRFRRIAGVDEVGRGPLAGPVVAAAVVLPWGLDLPEVRDSKQLSAAQRQACFDRIRAVAAAVGIGVVSAEEIDHINILAATLEAMRQAVNQIDPLPDFVIVDGPWKVALQLPQQPLKCGDQLSISVAAASIVAKVHRDKMMVSYHDVYPQYNFAQNKGYGTREHRDALARFGSCPLHRQTFRGVQGSCQKARSYPALFTKPDRETV
ncbi:MAG: ribonuclease HII [Deltaproteobacteria bacterium]|nr:MAG: ribonuclease HII [Deltaproteobacteria bacterium]